MSANGITPDLRQRSIVGCTAMAGFVYQLEANIVNVALPTLCVQLQLSTYEASLIPIIYILGAVTVLIAAGRLGVRLGLKRTFVLSIACMALGTVICGMAPCFSVLLGGRLIQGVGAGGLAAMGYAIIPAFLPPALTGYGYSRLSVAAGLGMIAGNPAGGILSQFLPWRFIFLVTVPFMLVLMAFSLRNLPEDGKTGAERPRAEPLSDSLMFGFIAASAIIGLSFGSKFGFASAPILGILLISSIFVGILVWRGRRGGLTFLPRSIIAHRMFSVWIFGIVVERCVMGGLIFLMPFYLTALCALPPAVSSILMLAYAAGFVLNASCSGAMADRGRSWGVLCTGSLVGACACALLAVYASGAQWIYALVFLVAIGAADGLFTPSANKSAVGIIPDTWKHQAAVFLPLAVCAGNALGVSLFEIVWSWPFPRGASFSGGTHSPGIPERLMVQGFQGAFLAGAVLWAGILLCIILFHKREEATGHGDTDG